jgi:HD-like signal output (HDOD) protein
MSADEQSRFLQGLAEDVNSKNIALPSFPDVVINIRTALEDPSCTPNRLSEVAKTDPVLVSRLLQAANSAFHNRAGIEIVDLDLAISRLGFEAVRNTAIALAVEQIFNASQYDGLRDYLKDIWDRSVSLSSMCFVLAQSTGKVNADNAFLCGLLHEIGKLYILTKAKEYPEFLGDGESLDAVLEQWHPTIGKSIVDSWGFSSEIAESVAADHSPHGDESSPANLADIISVSNTLLGSDDDLPDFSQSSFGKVNVTAESIEKLRASYELHVRSMRQAVRG